MANEDIPDVDGGVASSVVTPESQESSSLTPPEPSTDTTTIEQLTTPGAAASSEREKVEQIIAQMPAVKSIEEEESDEDILDESVLERLQGLTEMFPNCLRTVTSSLGSNSFKLISGTYWFTRQAVWIGMTTCVLLFAPVLFEVERVNTQEMIKQDRNKLVLGPGTAMSGGPPSGLIPK